MGRGVHEYVRMCLPVSARPLAGPDRSPLCQVFADGPGPSHHQAKPSDVVILP